MAPRVKLHPDGRCIVEVREGLWIAAWWTEGAGLNIEAFPEDAERPEGWSGQSIDHGWPDYEAPAS
jgi:hypothetical protein